MSSAVASPSPSAPLWWQPAARVLLPVGAFALFMACYWRIYDLSTAIPAYGDAVEYLWVTRWFVGALRDGSGSLLFAPYVFMPGGWSLATFANGIGVFLFMVPVAWLTNEAAAFNVLELAAFFVAYLGMYRLARPAAGRWAAILVALLYLLWGGRWLRAVGHLHILMGSALLPWMAYCLERSLPPGRRRWGWLAATGLLWALAISFSLYFIWIGLFLVVGWLLGAAWGRRVSFGRAAGQLVAVGLLAVLFCSPYLYLYWRGQTGAVGYDVGHLNGWSLSLNWLPALYPYHPVPFLSELARQQLNGVLNESSVAGFGIVLSILAVVGLVARGRRPESWHSAVAVAAIGILLALGPTLHWAGDPVRLPALAPLNETFWRAAHALKPDIFPGETPPPEFADGIPLPGLWLTAALPYFEGARVPSRYLLAAAPGILLLVAWGIRRLPKRGLKIAAVVLLLLEAARYPITGVPFPLPPHPAFAALAGLPIAPGESVLDLTLPAPGVLFLGVGGEVLWATTLHEKPIAGGGGSILPAHSAFLRDWFFANPDPTAAADFPTLLRGYDIRYLLLHMPPEPVGSLQRLAAGTPELQSHGCYDPASGPPWNHPICLIEVLPEPNPTFNVFPAENWGGDEGWGQWAMGRESAVRWAATNRDEARFAVEAFPQCIPGAAQEMEIVVAGRVLAAHRWDNCDPWRGEIVVPSELINIGWNEIVLRFARADRPTDVTGGANPDTRELSAGFARFEQLR